MHNAGQFIRKVTQPERCRLLYWAPDVSCDAPHEQRSLSPSDVSRLLKFTWRLKLMLNIQENHERSFSENARGSLWSTLTHVGTVRRGGGCDGGCVTRVSESKCLEGLHEG